MSGRRRRLSPHVDHSAAAAARGATASAEARTGRDSLPWYEQARRRRSRSSTSRSRSRSRKRRRLRARRGDGDDGEHDGMSPGDASMCSYEHTQLELAYDYYTEPGVLVERAGFVHIEYDDQYRDVRCAPTTVYDTAVLVYADTGARVRYRRRDDADAGAARVDDALHAVLDDDASDDDGADEDGMCDGGCGQRNRARHALGGGHNADAELATLRVAHLAPDRNEQPQRRSDTTGDDDDDSDDDDDDDDDTSGHVLRALSAHSLCNDVFYVRLEPHREVQRTRVAVYWHLCTTRVGLSARAVDWIARRLPSHTCDDIDGNDSDGDADDAATARDERRGAWINIVQGRTDALAFTLAPNAAADTSADHAYLSSHSTSLWLPDRVAEVRRTLVYDVVRVRRDAFRDALRARRATSDTTGGDTGGGGRTPVESVELLFVLDLRLNHSTPADYAALCTVCAHMGAALRHRVPITRWLAPKFGAAPSPLCDADGSTGDDGGSAGAQRPLLVTAQQRQIVEWLRRRSATSGRSMRVPLLSALRVGSTAYWYDIDRDCIVRHHDVCASPSPDASPNAGSHQHSDDGGYAANAASSPTLSVDLSPPYARRSCAAPATSADGGGGDGGAVSPSSAPPSMRRYYRSTHARVRTSWLSGGYSAGKRVAVLVACLFGTERAGAALSLHPCSSSSSSNSNSTTTTTTTTTSPSPPPPPLHAMSTSAVCHALVTPAHPAADLLSRWRQWRHVAVSIPMRERTAPNAQAVWRALRGRALVTDDEWQRPCGEWVPRIAERHARARGDDDAGGGGGQRRRAARSGGGGGSGGRWSSVTLPTTLVLCAHDSVHRWLAALATLDAHHCVHRWYGCHTGRNCYYVRLPRADDGDGDQAPRAAVWTAIVLTTTHATLNVSLADLLLADVVVLTYEAIGGVQNARHWYELFAPATTTTTTRSAPPYDERTWMRYARHYMSASLQHSLGGAEHDDADAYDHAAGGAMPIPLEAVRWQHVVLDDWDAWRRANARRMACVAHNAEQFVRVVDFGHAVCVSSGVHTARALRKHYAPLLTHARASRTSAPGALSGAAFAHAVMRNGARRCRGAGDGDGGGGKTCVSVALSGAAARLVHGLERTLVQLQNLQAMHTVPASPRSRARRRRFAGGGGANDARDGHRLLQPLVVATGAGARERAHLKAAYRYMLRCVTQRPALARALSTPLREQLEYRTARMLSANNHDRGDVPALPLGPPQPSRALRERVERRLRGDEDAEANGSARAANDDDGGNGGVVTLGDDELALRDGDGGDDVTALLANARAQRTAWAERDAEVTLGELNRGTGVLNAYHYMSDVDGDDAVETDDGRGVTTTSRAGPLRVVAQRYERLAPAVARHVGYAYAQLSPVDQQLLIFVMRLQYARAERRVAATVAAAAATAEGTSGGERADAPPRRRRRARGRAQPAYAAAAMAATPPPVRRLASDVLLAPAPMAADEIHARLEHVRATRGGGGDDDDDSDDDDDDGGAEPVPPLNDYDRAYVRFANALLATEPYASARVRARRRNVYSFSNAYRDAARRFHQWRADERAAHATAELRAQRVRRTRPPTPHHRSRAAPGGDADEPPPQQQQQQRPAATLTIDVDSDELASVLRTAMSAADAVRLLISGQIAASAGASDGGRPIVDLTLLDDDDDVDDNDDDNAQALGAERSGERVGADACVLLRAACDAVARDRAALQRRYAATERALEDDMRDTCAFVVHTVRLLVRAIEAHRQRTGGGDAHGDALELSDTERREFAGDGDEPVDDTGGGEVSSREAQTASALTRARLHYDFYTDRLRAIVNDHRRRDHYTPSIVYLGHMISKFWREHQWLVRDLRFVREQRRLAALHARTLDATAHDDDDDGGDTRTCPLCFDELLPETARALYPCGHTCCWQCHVDYNDTACVVYDHTVNPDNPSRVDIADRGVRCFRCRHVAQAPQRVVRWARQHGAPAEAEADADAQEEDASASALTSDDDDDTLPPLGAQAHEDDTSASSPPSDDDEMLPPLTALRRATASTLESSSSSLSSSSSSSSTSASSSSSSTSTDDDDAAVELERDAPPPARRRTTRLPPLPVPPRPPPPPPRPSSIVVRRQRRDDDALSRAERVGAAAWRAMCDELARVDACGGGDGDGDATTTTTTTTTAASVAAAQLRSASWLFVKTAPVVVYIADVLREYRDARVAGAAPALLVASHSMPQLDEIAYALRTHVAPEREQLRIVHLPRAADAHASASLALSMANAAQTAHMETIHVHHPHRAVAYLCHVDTMWDATPAALAHVPHLRRLSDVLLVDAPCARLCADERTPRAVARLDEFLRSRFVHEFAMRPVRVRRFVVRDTIDEDDARPCVR